MCHNEIVHLFHLETILVKNNSLLVSDGSQVSRGDLIQRLTNNSKQPRREYRVVWCNGTSLPKGKVAEKHLWPTAAF